jgi:hypothetical protein
LHMKRQANSKYYFNITFVTMVSCTKAAERMILKICVVQRTQWGISPLSSISSCSTLAALQTFRNFHLHFMCKEPFS